MTFTKRYISLEKETRDDVKVVHRSFGEKEIDFIYKLCDLFWVLIVVVVVVAAVYLF